MGCGCGQTRDQSIAGRMLRTGGTPLVLDDAGLYSMSEAPGCTEPYHGAFPAATVYVADLDGEFEKLFTRKDFDGASEYARRNDVDLVHVAVKQLCHEPVFALFGV